MSQKNYIPNIPETAKKRVVVIGGGFAGLKFIQKSLCQHYQLVLLDKNNYHQFQPLLYQVATAGEHLNKGRQFWRPLLLCNVQTFIENSDN